MRQDPHDQLLLQIRLLLPWTRAPDGYRLDPEQPRDPAGVRGESAAAVVLQEVFASCRADDGALLGGAKRWSQRQILTPTGQTRWNSATVRGLLTTPSYTGQV